MSDYWLDYLSEDLYKCCEPSELLPLVLASVFCNIHSQYDINNLLNKHQAQH